MTTKNTWQRTLVHVLFAIWFGGYTFYAAIVIPTAAPVLGGHEVVGFVTQAVTVYLNLIGLLLLATLLWHNRQLPCRTRQRRRILWWTMLSLQLTLLGLHPWLGSFLDSDQKQILEPDAFYTAHRVYLLVATALWLAALMKLHAILSD